MAQLDPIDTLVFSALIYEHWEDIERHRRPAEERCVFSRRLAIEENGQMFSPGYGWREFRKEAATRADQSGVSHVVTTDISDFFNSVSLHRLENNLELVGIPVRRAKFIEGFLFGLNAGRSSTGIPIGPDASAIMAETCLIDVDSMLVRYGVEFVRYVDDYHLFVSSEREAHRVLHSLAEYLGGQHSMGLNAVKTQIRTADDFVRSLEREKDGRVARRQRDILNDALSDIMTHSVYGEPLPLGELIDAEEYARIEKGAYVTTLLDLIDEALAAPKVDLGALREAFNYGAAMRTSALIPRILDHSDQLAVVLPSVARYIIEIRDVLDDKQARLVGNALVRLVSTSVVADLPAVRVWVSHLLASCPKLVPGAEVVRVLERISESNYGFRFAALAAESHRVIDWVNSHTMTWQTQAPWCQRAIVSSARIMPSDARRHWLRGTSRRGTGVLLRAVALEAMS